MSDPANAESITLGRVAGIDRGRIFDYPLGIDLTARDGSLTALFNHLSRVVPDGQQLITVSPGTYVADAIKMMAEYRISQVPVVERNHVLGVFSYRSFTRQLLAMNPSPQNPSDADVMDFVEQIPFCPADADVAEVIPLLDEFDAVLLGAKLDAVAIVTVVDALKFFYGLSSLYVLVAEIEIAIRALIRVAVDENTLRKCVEAVNAREEITRKLPFRLEKMTFGHYVLLVSEEKNWDAFRAAFGGHFAYTVVRLEQLRKLRNDMLHFSRAATTDDYDRLRGERQWLRTRIDLIDARHGVVS